MEGCRPMPAKYLRVSCAVKGFQNGPVVVQLCEWSIEGHEKSIVDTRMADIMANSGNQKCESIKRADQGSDR